ncbi:hypothetical protein ACTMU2_05255 [Cupriavidus basilensis]
MLRSIPQPARITLREEADPATGDIRVVLTLLTSFVRLRRVSAVVYTYAGLVLDRVTGGDERVLAGMLLIWGTAATMGNMFAGRLVDRFESRKIINAGALRRHPEFLCTAVDFRKFGHAPRPP